MERMEVEIEQVGREKKELVLIRCHAVTEEVREIAAYVKSRQGSLTGIKDNDQYEIAVSGIYYIESVDGRTFIYTKKQIYETPYRIYELENRLEEKNFLRILITSLYMKQIHAAESDEDQLDPAGAERAFYSRSSVGRGSDHITKLCERALSSTEERVTGR